MIDSFMVCRLVVFVVVFVCVLVIVLCMWLNRLGF